MGRVIPCHKRKCLIQQQITPCISLLNHKFDKRELHRIYFVFCKQNIILFTSSRFKSGLGNTSTTNNINDNNNLLYAQSD